MGFAGAALIPAVLAFEPAHPRATQRCKIVPMSQLVMLIIPAPANLDTLRECLGQRFKLNPKVESLGECEELHATNEDGRTTVFEVVSGGPSELIAQVMRKRGLDLKQFSYFWARIGWATSDAAALYAAERLDGWLIDYWNRLLTPQEYRELTGV